MDYPITHNVAGHRYEAWVDAAHCVLNYREFNNVLSIDHVAVPEAVAGHGIAAALTKAALDNARAQGFTVIAACPYAAAYIRRHPEYQDLLHSAV